MPEESLLVEPATPAPASETPSSSAPTATEKPTPDGADETQTASPEPADSLLSETKGKEGQEKRPEVPASEKLSYDGLVLPEESTLDAAHLTAVKEFATANKLTPEAAQAVLERDDDQRTSMEAANLESWTVQAKEWRGEVEADKELGGDALPVTLTNAKTALAKFFPSEFVAQLGESGFGNHPGLIRGLAAVGAAMAEPTTAPTGGAAASTKSDWETFYPNSGKEPGTEHSHIAL